jgi:hypothetical protein
MSAENENSLSPDRVSNLSFVLRGWDDSFETRASFGVIGILIGKNFRGGVSLGYSLVIEYRGWEGDGYGSTRDW